MASDSDKPVSTPRPLSETEMWTQLSNAVSLRSAQDQVLWSIFGTFWAANAILLVALFTTGRPPDHPVVGTVVSFVGVALSLVWHGVQHRALGHVRMHEDLMRKLEDKLNFDPDFAVSGFKRKEYDQYLARGPRARVLMPVCSLVAAFLWGLAFLFFFIQLVARYY